jgi:hypothetical protein
MSDDELRIKDGENVGRWEHGMIGICGTADGKYSRWEEGKMGGWKLLDGKMKIRENGRMVR